ncbi:C2H2 type zinc-finger-domain-containing protein [Fusarium tricinctum]|uniref:C2H2 type zinc-finger-domain-containing protein n=1 Tax=Fusarium tricinctum TaxID=61284 RepID=A0A8K0S0Y4_9HYPO|nr:C2H2 type zinc-finger-domain-containing protein [Fusarium tricinctum]
MTSTKPTCSLCDISFDNSQEHRTHAKSESHVKALRNRAAAAGLIEQTHHNNDTYSSESNHPQESSESDSDVEVEVQDDAVPDFDPKKCIICSHGDQSFAENLLHMESSHSLRIPYQEHLIVDLETVIWYLHFVIFTYHECIYCRTRSRTVEGIQQHMVGKGHCRVELSDEILEFYNLEGLGNYSTKNAVAVDSESLRLSSGKILSNRTASSARPSRQTTTQEKDQDSQANTAYNGAADALTTKDRKDAALASQLARLSVKDQQSLIHMPSSEQRSFLLQRKKELEAVQRMERKMRLKTERLNNKTMMKTFKNDVPGRSNG